MQGTYNIRATVKEPSGEQYPFNMILYIEKESMSGEINYKDICSGTIKGEIVSNNELMIDEKITTGDDICENGIYLYNYKHNILNKSKYYDLENTRNKVVINSYKFTPKSNIWNNISLKLDIEKKEVEIRQIEKKLEKPQNIIEQTKQEREQALYNLDHNHSEVYINGECTQPALAPKPDPFFDTEQKAKHHALAYCSVPFSCRLGVELARNKLDTGAKRFLASQSCSALALYYQNEGALLDETMFNLLDAASFSGCGTEAEGIFSGLFKGGSCIMSAATRLARVGQYIGCIDSKTQEFHNTYLDWKNAPEKRQKACQKDLDTVNNSPKIIQREERKMRKIQAEIDIEIKKLEQLENELEEVELLRKKQSELIKKLENS